MKPRVLRNWIWLVPLAALLWACLLSPLWATVTQDANGWTVVAYPPSGGGEMWFCDQDGGDDANDGRDPNGFDLGGGTWPSGTYTHSTRTLTSTGAFAGYTHTGGDRTDVIYLTGSAGSGVANGYYVIESKTSNDAVVLVAAAGLTADDTSIESSDGPKATVSGCIGSGTRGDDDQLCFQCGDTWTGEEFGNNQYYGTSADEPLIYCSYGSGARPKFNCDAEGLNVGQTSYVMLLGLHLLAVDRAADESFAAINGNGFGTQEYIHIENCYIDYFGGGVSLTGIDNCTIRRNIIVNQWGNSTLGDHAQGIFAQGCDNLLIEENILDHNGWSDAYPATSGKTIYNHNMYITTGVTNLVVRRNISSRGSSMGLKLQPTTNTTCEIYDNLFVGNSIAIQLGGGTPQSFPPVDGWHAECYNNVAVENVGTGWGVVVADINGGFFRNNFIGHSTVTGYPIQIADGAYGTQGYGVRDFDVQGNVIYDWPGTLDVRQPTEGSPVHSNITFVNNDIQQPDQSTGDELADVYNTTSQSFSGNNYYSNLAAGIWFDIAGTQEDYTDWIAAFSETGSSNSAVSYPDNTRNATTFATTNGYTDWPDLVDDLLTQQKGDWDTGIMAEAGNDWIREGYGLGEYSPTPDVTAPQFVSAELTGANVLTVNFDESVNATDETGFSLVASGGAATLTMTDFSGTSLAFTTSRTIYTGETLTLSYDSGTGDVADAADNALGDLTSESVTNSGSESPSATPGNSIIPGIYVR